MVSSVWKLEFVSAAGTLLLLDYGDDLDEELAFDTEQSVGTYKPIGAGWGEASAEGGAMTSLSWTVRRSHASHAALRAFCLRHPALMPYGQTGALRVSIQGGETWEIEDCALASSKPQPLTTGPFRSLTVYQATGGRMVPVSAIELYVGIPWEFILQNWEDITTNWEDI